MTRKEKVAAKGTVLWRFSKKFNFAAEKIIPESLVFCILLTAVVFILSLCVGIGPLRIVQEWWNGLSSQFTLAFQMGLMVCVCATCARSPQVANLLKRIANLCHSRVVALIVMMAFGYGSSMLNWAFCTIVTPILAMHLAKHIKGLHFPMMVAGGYCCMILGQCLGPSATMYSNIAIEGSDYANIVGESLSVAETCYNPMNICLWVIMAVVFVILVLATRPGESELIELGDIATEADVVPESYKETDKPECPADRMNIFRPCMWLIALCIFAYIVWTFIVNGILPSLNMNLVIFCFLGVNCMLFPQPKQFMNAHKGSIVLATEVMIQFPFYGGIMQVMYVEGGIGEVLINAIVSISTARTLPVFTFLSACLVNLFVPSQGGQFTVQGPLIVQSASRIEGANLITCLNAFVYGDECTNLIQPLYMIPALAVVGMKLKDVWGFMAFMCIFWIGMVIAGMLILPIFF